MNEEILRTLGFNEEVERAKQGKCPFCNTIVKVSDFKDELSKREYEISGLCQKCQDKFFG